MGELKTYNYQTEDGRAINVCQKQLTLGKELAIVKLFTNLEIQKPEDLLQLSIKDLIEMLINKELIYEVLSIILSGEYEKKDLADMPHDLLEEIIEDFFSFNARLSNRLKNLFAAIGSAFETKMAAAHRPSPQSDSSSPSAKGTSQKKKKSFISPAKMPSAG
jgi:hypothetical protein